MLGAIFFVFLSAFGLGCLVGYFFRDMIAIGGDLPKQENDK